MDSFWTDEDRAELKRLQDKFNVIHHTTRILTQQANEERAKNKDYSLEGEPLKENLQGLKDVELQLAENEMAIEGIYSRVRQRYFDSYKDNPEAIYTAIQEVLDAYELEDFTRIQRRNAENYKVFHSENEETNKVLKQSVRENYTNCFSHIYRIVSVELLALGHYGLSLEKAEEMIEEKARSYYPKRTAKKKIDLAEIEKEARILKPYVAMLNGTATNQLTSISTRSNRPIVDMITNTATIQQGSVSVFIDNYNKITGELRTSTHKLLDALTMLLTQQNNYRGKEAELKPTVSLPLEHFMELCGIPITKPSKDKTRKKAKEDLETLYHLSIEWKEQSGKNTRDFAKMRLCDKIGIVKGNIVFSFSQDMANYLTNAYIMQYPIELLKVDERNPNSYHIGKKLLLHNSIDNNRAKGTANIISVKKLLEACPDIPTYEQVLATGRQLDQRIKAPFEAGLNSLSSFVSWEYCNSKGIPLTEEQLQATDYNTFIQLFIKFDVADTPDQTPRLERKRERKAQSEKTAQKKEANK